MRIARWFILVLAGIVPGACNLPLPFIQTETAPAEVGLPESHPPEGTTLRWVDGSQVIIVDMDPTEGQIWITQNPITHYMYSLCEAAGQCAPARHDTEGEHNANAPIIDPCIGVQDAQAYCAWAGGRLATDDEIQAAAAAGMSTGKRGHVTAREFHCVLDTPQVTAPLCETSAMYKKISTTQDTLVQNLKRVAQFCQDGAGYTTADLEIVGCEQGAAIHSVSMHGEGACEPTEDNRLVCYGDPGSVAGGTALAACESDPAPEMTARTWDVCYAGTIPYPCYYGDWMASNSPLVCPTGYESSTASPALCSWSWGLLNQGCFHSMEPMSVTGGGFACTLPSSIAEETGLQDPASAPSTAERRCIYPMCGGTGLIEVPENSAFTLCPNGMYFDPELNGCISPGPFRDECLAGFEFDGSRGCCQSALPGGEYPGCPEGQAFDPATGSCDAGQIFTAEGVLVPVEFSLDLPACEGGNGAGGCQLTSAICAADGGQDFDAANCKCIPVQ